MRKTWVGVSESPLKGTWSGGKGAGAGFGVNVINFSGTILFRWKLFCIFANFHFNFNL